MKESFFVRGLAGEKKLSGEIAINSAKNAVIKAMAASILFDDTVVLEGVPDIEDVRRMGELLEHVGVRVEKAGPRVYRCRAEDTLNAVLDEKIAGRLRASIVLSGPLLARRGEVYFPHPGGCVIGARPIDLFLDGFERMGASVLYEAEHYQITAPADGLRGATIFFATPSHTGTETLMMAAVLARGTTTLKNCAMEPEIVDLADFLNAGGARISGAGTPTIVIEGGGLLHARGRAHRSIPDRIEAGSFLILGALCARELVLSQCNPAHLEILVDLLRKSGVPIETEPNRIIIRKNAATPNDSFSAFNVKTHEYPGFATDLQAPIAVYLTQVTGESIVFETIFDGRLNYVDDLARMGAAITVWDPHRMSVKGPTPLIGRALGSPDLRAGLAFVIAAAVAKGNSLIDNVYYIDRGYEAIETRLQGIGLPIERRGQH